MNENTRTRAGLTALFAALMVGFSASAQQAEEAPAHDHAVAPVEAPAVQHAEDPVLLQLGGTVERLSDVAWRFEVAMRSFAAGQGAPYTEELAARLWPLLPTYLEQRGTELVLLREAERRGLTPDEAAVEATLERLRASVAAEDYELALAEAGFPSEASLVTLVREADLINQVIEAVRAEAQPTEEELRVRYLADIALYTSPETFCARHVLVAELDLAQEVVDRVRAGEDFAQLASEYGTDGTRTRGGDLGCFERGMMIAPFEEAVVAATVGEVAGPVETQYGWHAVLVYDRRPAEVLSFEEVRALVVEDAADDAADAALRGLLRGSGLVVYPERVPGL